MSSAHVRAHIDQGERPILQQDGPCCLVLRVRAMMVMRRVLDGWKEQQKQRRVLADPQR